MSQMIAKASALQAYKPFFSELSQLLPHHIEHLGGIYYWAWWLDAQSKGRYPVSEHLDQVRRVLRELEGAYTHHPRLLGEVIQRTSSRLTTEQAHFQLLMERATGARKEAQPDARFHPLLVALQDMRESFFPTLMAPLVAAKGLMDTSAHRWPEIP